MSQDSTSSSRAAAARDWGRNVDFGRTSDDYARFRPGPPPALYDRLEQYIALRDADAADIGTGVGFAAIELASRGARVTGIDPSASQLEQAERLARERGVRVTWRVGTAEATGLPDASLDLWLAVQAWHWFDPVKAAREALRTLRPGGLAVCANFDYLPARSNVARRTEELILRYAPSWPMANGTGCHIRPLFDLPAAGFEPVEQISWEHIQPFTHASWRGRMRTCNAINALKDADSAQAFDRDLDSLLRTEFPDEPLLIPHRVWLVLNRKPRR